MKIAVWKNMQARSLRKLSNNGNCLKEKRRKYAGRTIQAIFRHDESMADN